MTRRPVSRRLRAMYRMAARTRLTWENVGGFVSVFCMALGFGVGALIDGKEWALVAGLVPAAIYLTVCWCQFRDDYWSKQI